jgi:chromosome segregation ATPase
VGHTVHEAQRALSEKESELAKRMRELDERSTLADAQKIEIITLTTKIGALEERLDAATNELKAVEDRRDAAVHEAQHALSEKESELAERMRELDERSTLADAQKIEIITLTTKIGAAFDRANGERLRLAYELANIKRQVEETWAAERIENPMLSDVAA